MASTGPQHPASPRASRVIMLIPTSPRSFLVRKAHRIRHPSSSPNSSFGETDAPKNERVDAAYEHKQRRCCDYD